MRVVQVGYGRWGQMLSRAIDVYPDMDLVAIHTRSELSDVRYVSTVERMLTRHSPEAVVVAAPLVARPSLVRQALQADMHVLTEKPLAPDGAQAEELKHLASNRGLVLHVNYVHAHSPVVDDFVKRFHGEEPQAIRITFGQPGELYADEGVDTLLLSHGLAISAQLLDVKQQAWVVTYRTWYGNKRPLAMAIRSGRHCIYADLAYPEKFRRIEAVFSDRTLVGDLVHPGRLLESQARHGAGISVSETEIDQNNALDRVFDRFVQACVGKAQDNREVAAWVDAALDNFK